jgi:hypothetical protein
LFFAFFFFVNQWLLLTISRSLYAIGDFSEACLQYIWTASERAVTRIRALLLKRTKTEMEFCSVRVLQQKITLLNVAQKSFATHLFIETNGSFCCSE